MISPRIRLGMVGGGQGAFIGAVHRIAARLDDQYVLVAGALSSDPARNRCSGAEIGLDPARCYDGWNAMFAAEQTRPDGIEAVSIVTPNDLHFSVARSALQAGLHVICEKPLVTTEANAAELERLAAEAGRVFAVTYNYSAYPLIRHARALVASGALGLVRIVQIEYVQDWLATSLETTGHKQAAWRTDPARAGGGGAVGDIGSHAFHLACFVTGLRPEALLAQLSRFVPGRRVDDDAQILLRFEGGARGMLWASQVAHGNGNALRLRVYGSTAGLEWAQEEPDRLWFAPSGAPRQMIVRGGAGAGPEAGRLSRLPAGHPEGYLEGFAAMYSEIARAIRADGVASPDVSFPTLADGIGGVRFIAAALRSSAVGGQWQML